MDENIQIRIFNKCPNWIIFLHKEYLSFSWYFLSCWVVFCLFVLVIDFNLEKMQFHGRDLGGFGKRWEKETNMTKIFYMKIF